MDIKQTRNLYGKVLSDSLQRALPNDKIIYFVGNICVHLREVVTDPKGLKEWLYSRLEKLPKIEHQLERIQFIVCQAGSMDLMIVINPSEFDVTALDRSIIDGVNFSSDATAKDLNVPMPLDHPWYLNKLHFRTNGFLENYAKERNPTNFNDIKALPNVQPLLNEMRKDGIKI